MLNIIGDVRDIITTIIPMIIDKPFNMYLII